MKSSFQKGRFPERNTTEAIKIVKSFKDGSKNEEETLTELYDIYFPKKLNLKYKNEILDKIKSNEYTLEEGERKLHWFFRLPHEYIERNTNKSPKKNNVVKNNTKYNKTNNKVNNKSPKKKTTVKKTVTKKTVKKNTKTSPKKKKANKVNNGKKANNTNNTNNGNKTNNTNNGNTANEE